MSAAVAAKRGQNEYGPTHDKRAAGTGGDVRKVEVWIGGKLDLRPNARLVSTLSPQKCQRMAPVDA
jgi:hypothetical protein